MKKRLLGDLLVYLFIPIILTSISNPNIQVFSTLIITMLGIGYSILIKYNQYRVNVSGVIFMSLYVFSNSFKVGAGSGYQTYAYNTYYMVGATIILIVLSMFNKNAVRQVWIDILNALEYSQMQINNIIKKHNLNQDFDKFSCVISIHLLILVLIRVCAIVNLGELGYRGYLNAEVLLTTLFLIIEFVCISGFVSKFKLILKTGKSKVYKKTNLDSETRVIHFNKYKNCNK